MLPPSPPSRPQLALALVGLVCVAASLVMAFTAPFGLWHWLPLIGAVLCLFALRRLRR